MKPFGLNYSFEEDYAYSVIQGESNNYREVIDKVKNRIEKFKINNIDEKKFEVVKKSLYGDFVRMFDNVSSIATTFISNYFRGIDTSDYAEAYKSISIAEAEKILNEHFDFENMVVSIIENK